MNNGDAAKRFFLTGLECLEKGDFANAEKFLAQTLELAPQSIPTLNNLAISQYEQKKFIEASETAEKAIEVDPTNIDGYRMLATCQQEQRKYEDALATCEKILAIDPTNAEVFCNRGHVLNQLQKYREAIESIDCALGLQPTSSNAYLVRGNSLRNLKRYDEALAAYDKALALKPNLPEASLGYGNVLNDVKRYDKALTTYDKVLALKPDSAEAWYGRGNALVGLKRFDKASAAFEKALALNPDLGFTTHSTAQGTSQVISEMSYNPAVFDIEDVPTAQQIILTAEDSTTEERWETETPYVADLISQTLKLSSSMTVLDYGCGIGRLAKELINRNGCSVVGVDISEKMRVLASQYVQSTRFQTCSPQILDDCIRRGQRFDAAISVWVLQHCLRPLEDILRIKQSLKPSAGLFVLNNIWRAVPVAGGAWANDGIDIKGLLKDQFALVQDSRLPPDKTTTLVAHIHFWSVFQML